MWEGLTNASPMNWACALAVLVIAIGWAGSAIRRAVRRASEQDGELK